MTLPPEVRLIVWRLYCPDLTATGRVLHFYHGSNEEHIAPKIRENYCLWSETKLLRTMMAVHQESRRIGLLAFPKMISLGSGDKADLIRINPKYDVIFHPLTARPDLSGFQHVENFCFNPNYLDSDEVLEEHLKSLPHLKQIFYELRKLEPEKEVMQWCNSERIHLHRHGGYHNRDRVCIWPNVADYPEFAEQHVESAYFGSTSTRGRMLKCWPLYCSRSYKDQFQQVPAHEICLSDLRRYTPLDD